MLDHRSEPSVKKTAPRRPRAAADAPPDRSMQRVSHLVPEVCPPGGAAAAGRARGVFISDRASIRCAWRTRPAGFVDGGGS